MRQSHRKGGGIATAVAVGKLASNTLFGPLGAKASNLISQTFGKNPEARDIFPGEKHVILPTKFGLTRANFAGPGTEVIRRIRRGDKGVDGPRGIDAISKVHDIDYTNAKTSSDIRRADDKMIRDVKRSSAGKKTKAIVIAALKAKKLGENLNIIDVNSFTQVVPPEGLGKGAAALPHHLVSGGALPASRLMSKALRKLAPKRKRVVNQLENVVQKIQKMTPGLRKRKRVGSGPIATAAVNAAKILLPILGKQLATKVLIPLIIKKVNALIKARAAK